MNDRSDSAGSVAAIIAGAILALLIVGGGLFFYFSRHVAATQRRAALAAQTEARLRAEQARQSELAQRATTAKALQTQAKLEEALAREANAEGSPEVDRDAILAVIETQRAAWNAGDIPAFMQHYWESDDLTFSSGGETTRGWNATLQRYQTRYPTPEKMGELNFSNLEVYPIADSAALVLGEWRLTRDPDPVGGNFSIIFRKIDDRWLIVHDHTSVRKSDEIAQE